jgi:hypothetical protein
MNHHLTELAWMPDLDALTHQAGDSAARKTCLAALEEHDRLQELRAGLNSIRRVNDCWAELEKEGLTKTIPPAMIKSAIDEFREEPRDELQGIMATIISDDHLAAAVWPEIRRCLSRTAALLRVDAKKLAEVEAALVAKYNAPEAQSDLLAGLTAAGDHFHKLTEKPFKLSWHWKPRQALSAYFDKPL